jgi:hypothetical protein
LMPGWRASNSEPLPPSLSLVGERHMTPATHEEASPTFGRYAAEEMAKYGITRVPTDYFHYKEYRYTDLDDAVAQAKRQHPAVLSDGPERSGSR